MTKQNRDLYSIIYDSDYSVANLVQVAEKIRQEQKSGLSVLSIKNLIITQPMSEEILS